ncbi:hypothetical protein JCM21738_4652 [Mesobacillus boroniphilus JCM 21738]|uniref:Uncharacterized protein n=1 Tax=Mesobacillus boroniphilus JCM 21738 TaxID=1294265 RepID=W4RVG7_9BACI|nr:hypothetical protein JCM21738_4652 [Mesobacillus boroniphilus JCM 21738]
MVYVFFALSALSKSLLIVVYFFIRLNNRSLLFIKQEFFTEKSCRDFPAANLF